MTVNPTIDLSENMTCLENILPFEMVWWNENQIVSRGFPERSSSITHFVRPSLRLSLTLFENFIRFFIYFLIYRIYLEICLYKRSKDRQKSFLPINLKFDIHIQNQILRTFYSVVFFRFITSFSRYSYTKLWKIDKND